LTVRSDNYTAGQKDRTFTEAARRSQIVAAAIDTIAESGYGQASLARIASRIGVSKGVIAYHFDGKDDLINEVIAEVAAKGAAYIRSRVMAEPTGTGRLRALIEANLAFMGEHRNHLIALVQIAANVRDRARDGSGTGVAGVHRAGVAALRDLLAASQAQGEFRADFDPQVMAMAIRAAIDAVPPRLAADPGFDLSHYGRELADLFDAATRNEVAPAGRHGR
jgi:AcrR family transcriptional regulator